MDGDLGRRKTGNGSALISHLKQLASSLVINAIKHTWVDGKIRLT